MGDNSIYSSKRFEFSSLLLSGIMVTYILRVNMSIAVKSMADEYNWSNYQKGFVLSSFYWGYTIGQVPTSILAQIYNCKHIFGLGVFLSAVFTLFVPISAEMSFGFLIFLRFLTGLCESSCFPAVFHFYNAWIPLNEKTFLISYIISGIFLGNSIGFSLSGVIASSSLEWEGIFYLFGGLGCAWFPIWMIRAYETPDQHPSITKEELMLIKQGKDDLCIQETDNPTAKKKKLSDNRNSLSILHDDRKMKLQVVYYTPWILFMTNIQGFALNMNQFVLGFISFTLLSEMPTFLTDELHFSLRTAGILCIFPYILLFIFTILFGRFFNHLQYQQNWNVITVRRVSLFISFIVTSIFLVISGCLYNRYAAYVFLVTSQVFFGAVQCSVGCSWTDAAPNFSSSFNSLGNTFSAIAGIIGPLILAAFQSSLSSFWVWRALFLLTLGQSVLGVILWYCLVTSTVVDELNTLTKPMEDIMVANRGNHDESGSGTGVLNAIHNHGSDDIY